MAYKRNKAASNTEIRTGRRDEACARYSLGQASLDRAAKEAGAIIRIGNCKLYSFAILDAYFEQLASRG